MDAAHHHTPLKNGLTNRLMSKQVFYFIRMSATISIKGEQRVLKWREALLSDIRPPTIDIGPTYYRHRDQ